VYSLVLTDAASAKQAEVEAAAKALTAANQAQTAANQARTAAINRWAGEWSGDAEKTRSVDSGRDWSVDSDGTYAWHKIHLTLDVDADGKCSAESRQTDILHYRGGTGDEPTVWTRNFSCEVVSGSKLHLDDFKFDDVKHGPGEAYVAYRGVGGEPMQINLKQQ
jgi:hypothetical protein